MKKTPILQSLVFACGCLALVPAANAATIEQSTVSEVVRQVNVIEAAGNRQKAAKPQDVFRIHDVMRTGSESRAEMIAPDQTVTRIGANTVFSFSPEKREINLQRGSVLFSSPTGKGGGTIKTGAATASVLGTTIIVVATKNGGFKMLVLEGRGKARLPNGKARILNAGQLIFILPGSTDFGPAYDFHLSEQIAAALLVNGFKRPLPSMDKILAAIEKQESQIATGQVITTRMIVGEGGMAHDPNPRQEQAAVLVSQPEDQGPIGTGGVPKRHVSAGGNITLLGLDIAQIFSLTTKGNLSLQQVNFQTDAAMQARTINLTNVKFAAGSKVLLASQNGQLAPNPNTGQKSMSGFVNYISGVLYAGSPAQNFTGIIGSGQPITIAKKP